MADTREKIVYRAKLAEQAERYDEMADFMKSVAEMPEDLSVEDRNLLSVAYKNAVGARRAAWRIVTSVETKQIGKGNTQFATLAAEYRGSIEKELNKICDEILVLLEKHLIPSASTDESKVFYYKMKGDYHRYISEFASTDKRNQEKERANAAYQSATEIAQGKLLPTHPIRLGLALNYSVFFYEIMDDRNNACKMAQDAFDAAIAELDNVSEDSYRDSTLIMQLLRDNLTLWSSDAVAEQPGVGDGSSASPPAEIADKKDAA